MTDHAHDFLRGKRVVVFGAGYVGGAVVQAALRAGAATVVAVTRTSARTALLRAAGAAVVELDVATLDAVPELLRLPVDYVLNSVSSGGGGVEGYRRSYVEGGRAILRWARGTQQRGRYVYTSSTSVYPQDGGVRVDETAATAARDERTALLLEAEQLALSWPGAAVVLRLAGIYGPGRHGLLDALREGAAVLPGRGSHRLNLIHRRDAVAAVLAAWSAPEGLNQEVFNVVDDHPVAKAEVAQWLAERLQRPLPEFTGVAASGRSRVAVPNRIIDNGKLHRVLGWRPSYPDFRAGYGAILRQDPGADAKLEA